MEVEWNGVKMGRFLFTPQCLHTCVKYVTFMETVLSTENVDNNVDNLTNMGPRIC
jgi:hypothetical protein